MLKDYAQFIHHYQAWLIRVDGCTLIEQVIDDVEVIQENDALSEQMSVYDFTCNWRYDQHPCQIATA